MRVDLAPVSDRKACYEQALGDAVRAINAKLPIRVYLALHTSEQALARGIDRTVHVAAKRRHAVDRRWARSLGAAAATLPCSCPPAMRAGRRPAV
jgi:hypothetical protein